MSPNGVNIRPGDGTVQNFYSGNGNRDLALRLGAKGYEAAFLRRNDGSRLTAFYDANGRITMLFQHKRNGAIFSYEGWDDGQYIHMAFVAKNRLSTMRVIENAKDNTYRGGDKINWFEGRDGNDRLFGGAGDDLLDGGDGADALYGDAGNDVLKGGTGNDTLVGGDGDDKLSVRL